MKSILFLGPFSLFFPLENGRERGEPEREKKPDEIGRSGGGKGGGEGIHRGSIFSRVRGREAEKEG